MSASEERPPTEPGDRRAGESSVEDLLGEAETRKIVRDALAELSAPQRAALELTEAMTRLADHPVSDEIIDRAAAEFSERELAELIWVITVINAWNRLGATARPWPLS